MEGDIVKNLSVIGIGGGLLGGRSRKVINICGKITSNRFQSLLGKSQRSNE